MRANRQANKPRPLSELAQRAVFLSYASQDAEAARRIAEALRAAGVEVWFDQSELRGGDSWDAKIRKQIKECALFVPVISAATQARSEGYFRLEWKLAVDRSHLMADDSHFLFPVVIDDTPDATARVPDKFRDVQWTRLSVKDTPETLAARVGKLLAGTSGQSGAVGSGDPVQQSSGNARRRGKSNSWVRVVVPIAGMLFGLIFAFRAAWSPAKHSEAKPAAAVTTTALTEAQKLVAQAQKVYENSDELDRETLILADDLVKRALALDAGEPSAWLLGAQLSYAMVWQSFDMSEARKADLQRQAARARALAPESVPAQLAVANARVAVAYSNFKSASNRQDLADVERDLLALAKQAPRDYQVQRSLGQTYRFLKRPDEAQRALQRALELSGGNPAISADMINVNLRRKNYAEAEAIMAPALARRPTGRLMVFDVFVKTRWRGDMAAAQTALATWPGWLLREDRGAFVAWQTWLWSRQPDRALDVAQRLPRDYLHDVWFTGPRAVLTARAHEIAGHREAAQADWRTVVRLTDQELASSPDDVPAMFWKAWALSRLGDETSAEAVCTILQQRVTTQTVFLNSTNLSLLWSTMGRTDLAAAHLRAGFGADDDTYAVTRAMLELDPAYEALRKSPQFAGLAAAALAPAAIAAPITKVEEKSVAVLAFANLSDDKGNEYFSDGISEELLNVLAKVPGLKVTARTSSFHFKGKDTPIPEIAQQLGVAYVIEGSVRKAGNKVRITAQLIKAADGFHVWSDTFTRDLKDIFAVQDEIAGLIARNLELKIAGVAQVAAIDPEAYRIFLEARHLAQRENIEGWNQSIILYRRAIERDSGYAAAWAELAQVYQRLARFGGLPALEGMREARTAAQRALELDPKQVVGLDALGWVQRTADWDWMEAKKSFQQALQLAPENPVVMVDAAVLYVNIGRVDEGRALARRAVERDPLSATVQFYLGVLLEVSGRFEESLQPITRAIELAPAADEFRTHLARALACAGRLSEAEAIAKQEPNEGYRVAIQSFICFRRGDLVGGTKLRNELIANYSATRTGYIAIGYADTGDRDEAFVWLNRAYDIRDAAIAWSKTGVVLQNLHADPRWPVFLRKIGLADDQLK